MSLHRNVLANYASQIYVTLIGIVVLPVYLKYMGAEAYGLVGFFAMLQAWFQILDLGLSPAMARQAARFRGGALSAYGLYRLLRLLEKVFVAVALLGAMVLVGCSGLIASYWLQVSELNFSEVRWAVALMACTVSLRWVSGLYRGVIWGFEHLQWLGAWNATVATLRFVGVLPVVMLLSARPVAFFSYQLLIALLEVAVLVAKAYRTLPNAVGVQAESAEPHDSLRGMMGFSLSIAFTSTVWILVTQTDKLVLSKFLSLADYGYFSLAVMLASGVTMLSGPISTAIVPRLTWIHTEGDDARFIQIYRSATQAIVVIALSAALTLGAFPTQILWVWTGNADFARETAPVLSLYGFGNGVMVVAAFQHSLQFAKGNLTLHVIGNAVFVAILLPSLVLACWKYGMVGAGWVWLLSNCIMLIFWVPLIHKRFVPGLHWGWLRRDVALPLLSAAAAALLLKFFIEWPSSRWGVSLLLPAVALLILTAAACGSSFARNQVSQQWSRLSLRLIKN